MAVALGGAYGNFFNQYNQLSNARDWNTKNYDYATVKNKGEIAEDAKNETPDNATNPTTYGTGLFVKTNKHGYVDNKGRFTFDPLNPTYQIVDKYQHVDNNYYVDQANGNVYFRPKVATGAGVPTDSITLPSTVAAPTITNSATSPQYFGTAFNLKDIPNPESFGKADTLFGSPIGALNNLLYSTTGTTKRYSEIIVNGVQIAVGSLDTSLGPAIPALPSDALYAFSNSFNAGADDFSPVRPLNKWQNAYPEWPGTIAPIGAGTSASPTINTTDSMWIRDFTDTDFSPTGASAVGVTDVSFRRKFNITAAISPTTPINVNVGTAVASDIVTLYVNGVAFPVTGGTSTSVDIHSALQQGQNIIGLQVNNTANQEGAFVSMNTVDAQALGSDLSVSAGSWQATLGTLTNATYPLGTFQDAWTYEPGTPNGRYTNSDAERILKQSNFNSRTADNFILKTDISMLREAATNNVTDWVGVQIRASRPTDNYADSGYTVMLHKNGAVTLYKAHGGDPVPPSPYPYTDLSTGLIDKNIVQQFGSNAALAFSVPPAAPASKKVEIHANGTNIQVFVDGTSVLNFDDNKSENPYTDGYTSLATFVSHTAYNNFQLYSYTPAIQLLSRALKKGENSVVIKGYDDSIPPGTTPFTVNVDSTKSVIGGVNLGTQNIVPDIYVGNGSKDPSSTNILYKDSSIAQKKGYWSVSQNSALGLAGKIVFQNREGSALQKVRDQFSNVNSVMEDITSLLGATDDLFKSQLNIIR